MQRFAALYAELDATRATRAKVEAMKRYFASAPDEDAAWAVFFLGGRRLRRVLAPSRLRQWIGEDLQLSPPLLDECYAHVGDLAETLALLLDTAGRLPRQSPGIGLAEWVARLQALAGLDEAQQRAALLAAWRQLPREECYLVNKLVTGELRVGVAAGLVARALAEHAGVGVDVIQHRLMGDWLPEAASWHALLRLESAARPVAQPYPFCLASPLEDAPETLGEPADYLVEWKWDGIRAQLIRRDGQLFLWSRGEELLNGRFPEVEALAAQLPDGCVLDGEILAWREGVLPFAVLQRRIGRKTLGRKLLEEAPVSFLAYDLLEWQDEDWRTRPLATRRQQLERLAQEWPLALSPRVIADNWNALAALRAEARERRVEGLMLKRGDSAYLAGRKRGVWWKWKIGALTVDTVLVYAQAGHGRRAHLYTDYTLAVWQGAELVPVAKAYSGLTDEELVEMDRWIRSHTTQKFGPVRMVEPLQVFEIAFEGIQRSTRHKAGLALRFPRIARWRRDKPPQEADTLDTLQRLLPA